MVELSGPCLGEVISGFRLQQFLFMYIDFYICETKQSCGVKISILLTRIVPSS
jgi:hypothetical protein